MSQWANDEMQPLLNSKLGRYALAVPRESSRRLRSETNHMHWKDTANMKTTSDNRAFHGLMTGGLFKHLTLEPYFTIALKASIV